MSWLRIDDSFADHPKLLGLTLKQRWTWVNVLCYCARFDTEGRVPAMIGDAIAGATMPFLQRCLDLGLLEKNGPEYVVHDWLIYNAKTVEERVAYFLSRQPTATANEVFKAIGGKREVVLSEVARYRSGTPGGTQAGTQDGTREPEKVVPELVHGPYPNPRTTEGPSVNETTTTKEARGEDDPPAGDDDIDFTNGKTNYLHPEPDRDLNGLDHLFTPGILPDKAPR